MYFYLDKVHVDHLKAFSTIASMELKGRTELDRIVLYSGFLSFLSAHLWVIDALG